MSQTFAEGENIYLGVGKNCLFEEAMLGADSNITKFSTPSRDDGDRVREGLPQASPDVLAKTRGAKGSVRGCGRL